MRAAIYCRVSHPAQVKKGQSLPRQEAELTKLAVSKGFTEWDLYIEPGISGKNDERPQYSKLLAGVTEGKYEALFVYDITRLTRSGSRAEQDRIIQILKGAECDLFTTGAQYDLRNPQARFMFGINAEVASYENDIRTEKVTKGRQDARERGKNPGQAPATGYVKFYQPDGTLIYKLDKKAAAPVKLAFKLALNGAGGGRIREALHEKGYRTKTGNPLGLAHVYQWLRNPTYAGYVHVGMARGSKAKVKGMWPANFLEGTIVTLEEWERVQELLDGRARKKNNAERYPLSGILCCPSCGEVMHGQYKRWAVGTIRYYSCIPSGSEVDRLCPGTQGKSIKLSVAHKLLLESLDEIMAYLGKNYKTAWKESLRRAEMAEASIGPGLDLEKERKALDGKIKTLVRAFEDEPSDAIRARIRELEKEAASLKKLMKQQETAAAPVPYDLEEIINAVHSLDPGSNELVDNISSVLFTKLHYKRTGTHRKYTFKLSSVEFKDGTILTLKRGSSFSQ